MYQVKMSRKSLLFVSRCSFGIIPWYSFPFSLFSLKMESNQVQRNRKKRRVYHELDLELSQTSSLAYSALSIVLHHWMIPTQGWQLPSLITEIYNKSKGKMIEFKQTTSGEIDLMAYRELLNTDQVEDDCVDMLANAIKVLREVDTGQELQHYNIQVNWFFHYVINAFVIVDILLATYPAEWFSCRYL